MIEKIKETLRTIELAAYIIDHAKINNKDLYWCESVEGVSAKLYSYVDEKAMTEARDSLDMADMAMVYLVVRDYLKTESKALLCIESVAKYFGCKVIDCGITQPSSAVKVTAFGCDSVIAVSRATAVPQQTLRDWFFTKPITFHALMLFAKKD